MKTWFKIAALAAAVAAVPVPSLYGQAAEAPPATQPAKPQAEVPVKQVVLFSSGVGYFEHFGSVRGDGSTELRFKTNQINDILKSLLLQDLDGGTVNTIQYPSQDPIAKTLRSFQVDITNNPPLAMLLNQLRGAQVTIVAGGDTFAGVVLGAEMHRVQPKPDQPPVETWRVNILSGATIRQVEIDKIASLKIEDPKLQEELTRALAALAQARDQDKKPVTINFTGQGERRVRLGYVVETPIWKTSYRLILAGPAGKPEGDNNAVAKPANKLQGWAIVENQTDNDWTNVQLSLVSGRPISFVQDLYQPLYIPRPVVQQELYASLKPQTYDAGMDRAEREKAGEFRLGLQEDKDGQRARRGIAPAAPPAAAAKPQSKSAIGGGLAAGDEMAKAEEQLDASASVRSVASAAKVGELFQYTVGNVSLPRQKSAMIPIITDDVEVEKLSIYNQSVLAKNPLNGARVKNTTGKHLLAGPITVLDGATYAGDAQIDNLPPGQERLLSYGIDLQMLVDPEDAKSNQSLLSGKINRGVLYLTHKNVIEQTYLATNKGDNDKTLIVEHPRMDGWKLVEGDQKPVETTDQLYRYKGQVAAGKSSKLTIKQEMIHDQAVAILDTDVSALLYWSKRAEISPKVKDALAGVIGKKNEMVAVDRQIQQKQARLNEIKTDQARIRENIKVLEGNAKQRQLDRLEKNEDEITKLQDEIKALQADRTEKQQAFEKSLETLNVD
jgi:hypothetical protein